VSLGNVSEHVRAFHCGEVTHFNDDVGTGFNLSFLRLDGFLEITDLFIVELQLLTLLFGFFIHI
jgi:hypothetical protein